MIVKNNYGRTISCTHKDCQNETTGYFVHHPPFASAIDCVYIAYCDEHKKEAEDERNKSERSKDRINQAGSNS